MLTWSAFWRLFDRAVQFLAVLAGVVLVVATVVVLTEIVSRYFFYRPILGAIELTEYCLLWATFLAVPWLQGRDGNIRIDFVLWLLSERIRLLLLSLTCFFSALVCGILVVFGFLTVISHFDMNYRLPTPLHPLSAPILAIIPFGSLLLAIQFLRQAVSRFVEMKEQ